LQIAQTGRALSKIRRYLREEERERGRELGREMLENELKKHGVQLARTIRSGLAKRVARELGVRTVEQLFLAVATGNIGLMVVVRVLAPDVNFDQRTDEESPLQAFMNRIRRRSTSPVLVGGEQDVLVGYARCCNPLPGEPVAGFITLGRGITIHLATCPQLLASEPERKIAVEWDSKVVARHHGELRVVCADRPGLLANISKIIESAGINISRIEAHNIGDEKSTINIEVAVTDISELHTLIRGLERIRGVLSADRVRG
jgi:GTP pyrophosphokinase